MTLVDFYVLSADNVEAQHHFVCRLTEKAVKHGNRVMIAARDKEESEQLDEKLWTYRPESFVPHALGHEKELSSTTPVVIQYGEDNPEHHDLLINLCMSVPEQFSRFKRLAEIVIQDENSLKASRESYAFYKVRGYPINTHKLNIR